MRSNSGLCELLRLPWRRVKRSWRSRWRWADPAGHLSVPLFLHVNLSPMSVRYSRLLVPVCVHTWWNQRHAHASSGIRRCMLVLMCQHCVNPVPQVCLHLLPLPPAGDWVSLFLLLWARNRTDTRPLGLPSESPSEIGTDYRANPLSLPTVGLAAGFFHGQYLTYLLMFFLYFCWVPHVSLCRYSPLPICISSTHVCILYICSFIYQK